MIIGLVLLGSVTVLLFFGVAERVFKSFGIAYWLAFVMVGVLIGCAFIPSFALGAATVNVAGFVAPILFGAVFIYLAARARELTHALVALSTVATLYIAVKLLLSPITGDTVTVVVSGFLCGSTAYLVGKTKTAALAATFGGFPIGEIAAMTVETFAFGSPIELGSAAAFDACVLAAVFSVVLYEAIAAIKRNMNSKARRMRAENAEVSAEFDPDEYKKYFDE